MSWDGLRTPGARRDRWTGRALGLALLFTFAALAGHNAALAQEAAPPAAQPVAAVEAPVDPAASPPVQAAPEAVPPAPAASTASMIFL